MGYWLWGNKREGCTQGATLSLLIVQGSRLTAHSSLLKAHTSFNDLAAQVAGDVGDMNPTAIALPNKLSKPNLPRLLHLLYEFEQTAVVGLVARDEVCRTAE